MKLTAAILVAIIFFAGCGPAEQRQGDGTINVVTTTSMIADLAREIGGEHVTVTGLMGPGIDPHLYKASAGDVTRMSQADVILYNGLHLEGKMTEVFEQMQQRGISTVAIAEKGVAEDELIESPAFQGNYDPHVWFDVSLWKNVAAVVASTFSDMDPENAEAYAENLKAYQDELTELDTYVRGAVSRIPEERRVLITSHDAFGYFGRAYDVDVRGLQGISTATEAGTADVQALAEFVADRRIPALFVESSVSPKGIEAVREAVRARGYDVAIGGTLYGDALGAPDSPAGNYIGMVRENANTIVQSLRGEPQATTS